jgi:cytochrome c oxidase subunit 2
MWEQMPPAASTFAPTSDPLFYAIHWISAFFFLLLTVILLYSVVKWRRKTEDQPAASNVTHNSALEVTWTVIPLIIVMVIFVWGWQSARDMTLAPKDALTYKVVAKKWDWTITAPRRRRLGRGGQRDLGAEGQGLCAGHEQQGRAAQLLQSRPFRVKRDVIPGRYQDAVVQADDARRRSTCSAPSTAATGTRR